MNHLKPIGIMLAALSLPSCIVAYKEAQARREGLSDDPDSSGFYHYDKGLAERKNTVMRQDLRKTEATLEARRAEISRLKYQISLLKAQRAAAVGAAAIEAIDAEIEKANRKLLALEEAT